VDGKAAGIIGLSHEAMSHPYPGATKWMDHMIMRFAFGAPHRSLRLTRLATMLALCKSTADLIQTPANSLYLAASQGLLTIEYTRHPEAKGLRGLMKLVHREDHVDGHRLVYRAPWRHQTPAEVLAEFLTKEAKWQASRKK
ncbi:MAG TPA: hypothetical protein VFV01_47645, partial [Spirillospora sp.]|nr:hypothetical protein [Spirillospora sp.]